jgi:hypothetical protein
VTATPHSPSLFQHKGFKLTEMLAHVVDTCQLIGQNHKLRKMREVAREVERLPTKRGHIVNALNYCKFCDFTREND